MAISQQTPEQWSQAIAKSKLSKAWQMFRKGLEEVRERFVKGSGGFQKGFGKCLKRFGRGRERNGPGIREEIGQIREKAYRRKKKESSFQKSPKAFGDLKLGWLGQQLADQHKFFHTVFKTSNIFTIIATLSFCFKLTLSCVKYAFRSLDAYLLT